MKDTEMSLATSHRKNHRLFESMKFNDSRTSYMATPTTKYRQEDKELREFEELESMVNQSTNSFSGLRSNKFKKRNCFDAMTV